MFSTSSSSRSLIVSPTTKTDDAIMKKATNNSSAAAANSNEDDALLISKIEKLVADERCSPPQYHNERQLIALVLSTRIADQASFVKFWKKQHQLEQQKHKKREVPS